MPKFITENDIEQIALTILQEDLGYTVLYGPDIADGIERTYKDVVLNNRLRKAIDTLNPTIPTFGTKKACKLLLDNSLWAFSFGVGTDVGTAFSV